jgi:transposase-like protein
MNSDTLPQTLTDAIVYFADPQVAHDFMVQLRWQDGVVKCPRCQNAKHTYISTRRTWECKCCAEKKQFSVKTGTIFEESPLPLAKWLATIWLIANAKNGISSYEIHRAIGVTQKTAWFMLHRIRTAMRTGSFDKMKGEVEVDETFIGGLAKFMHGSRNKRRGRGTGGVGKSVVVGLLERGVDGSRVKAFHAVNRRKVTVEAHVRENVEIGAEVFSDALPSYNELAPDFRHQFIDHAECYVNGKVHTNGLENFWSLLKRTLKGTYVSVDPVHLFRYLDEQVMRYNNRKTNDASRFLTVMQSIIGKRLTYGELTGESSPA